jgi:transcriptional regulator with XRE-family HTH domain
MAFGSRIRELRLAAGLTQEALAEASGLHRTYVGSLERGSRNVGVLNIYALAAALGVPPGALLP